MKKENLIKHHASPQLWAEIMSLVELSHDEGWDSPYSVYDAFCELSDRSESCDEWKSLRTPARKVHIALGEYVELSEWEIQNTVTLGGNRKPWAFKLGGKAYQWA